MDKIGVFSLQKSLFCVDHSLIFIIWPSNASNSTNTWLEKRGKNTCFTWSCKILQVSQVSALEDGFGALHLCHPDLGETHEATVTVASGRHRKTENSPKLFKTDVKIALELHMIWNLGKVFKDPVAVFGGSAFLTCFQAVEVAQHICAGVPYVRRLFIVRRLFNGRRFSN